MTPRSGEPRVEARNDRYWVVHDAEGNLRGDARRTKVGDWAVSRSAWRGDSGNGPVSGVGQPSGPLVVALIPAGVAVNLQKKMVKAMLHAIASTPP